MTDWPFLCDQKINQNPALAQTGGLAIQNAAMYLALQNDLRDLKEDIWSHGSWFLQVGAEICLMHA